ncbi:ATP-binding protein [Desulfococcus sp.]|uniref:ATP-binding protein n=1 Tax=Desulfococcus sp. TaxID=2025834 RepID=UPI0035943BAF
MQKKELDVYVRLQRHLDRQPVGFPATPSGAEIRILRHIFTPGEAEIAACLSWRPEPLERIYERAGHLTPSSGKLEKILERIREKGGLESSVQDGRTHYANAPLVVGMYEMQVDRLTPQFVRDFNEYTGDRRFGIEFLSTALPQMRTIPVAKSIQPRHHAAPFDAVTPLIEGADAPFVLLPCICRKKREMEGAPCRVTDEKETCLAMGGIARSILLGGTGREISRREAMAVITQNQQAGLVLQPSNTEKAEFICSCCGCCCGMLDICRKLPRPLDYWAANFQAAVDPGRCTGCGLCEQRCQVGAVCVPEKGGPAVVDLDRCIGCGVCVAACPTEAVMLKKKSEEVRPPRTREDLYGILMARKKGRLEKLKLTGKLIVDAVRTGRTDLLKRLAG